ncbi:MAG TPA: hypothetical protein ENN72_00150 [Firmicutes bacterium]|nr:hypothetical protein [Bacillota bacterium]
MKQRGSILLSMTAFLMAGVFLLSGIFLRSYFQSQRAQKTINRTKETYALEGDLQRAIALVTNRGRKDLDNPAQFPNQDFWLAEDFHISVREFDNWEGYVVNSSEPLHEVNTASPLVDGTHPVSVRVFSPTYGLELEYCLPGTTISQDFTVYAHGNVQMDVDGNYYPYILSTLGQRQNDVPVYSNDLRVENALFYYNGSIVTAYPPDPYELDGKFDVIPTDAANKRALTVPTYLQTDAAFTSWVDSVIALGPTVVPAGNIHNGDLTVSDLNSVVGSQPGSSGVAVVIVRGDLIIDAHHDIYSSPIDRDILYIVEGDTYIGNVTGAPQPNNPRNPRIDRHGADFWISGRLGIVASGDITIRNYAWYVYYVFFIWYVTVDYEWQTIGGNIYLAGDNITFDSDMYLTRSQGGNNYILTNGTATISGKIFANGNLWINGTDNGEQTGDDFTDPKALRGVNITDNPTIFDGLPINLQLTQSSSSGNGVWR